MGLSPNLVETIFETIRNIRQQGTTIFSWSKLRIANRGYVLQAGSIVLHDTADALLRSDLVRKSYLGEKFA